MTNKEKALVEKLEQEINNDLDMNVETEQFISTDTYVGMFNGMVRVYLDENLGDSCIIAYIDKGINSGIKIEVL